MKNGRMLMVFVAICFISFSCGQPKAPAPPAAPSAPPTAPSAAPPAAPSAAPPAVAEEQDDVGEVEAVEVAPEITEAVAEAAPEEAAALEEVAAPEEVVAPEEAAAPVGEPAVEGGTPKLVVPEPTFDFGTMRDTETVTHHFVLRNEGTGILKITNVRASCGCTTTDLEKNTLEPGEQVKVGAVTKLQGRQGRQTKMVTVTTNDPESPTVQLRMQGTVTASIAVEPDRVNFGEIRDDEPREATVNIKSTVDDLTFAINSADLTGMDFIQHEIKTVEEGKSYDLVIKTVGELPQGNHNGRMIIRTDSRERSVIWLSISMQVIGAVQIMPPVVHIRHSDTPGEVTSQQLRISPGRIGEFEILEVVVPVESMKAALTQTGDNIYLLRLDDMPCSDVLEDKAIIIRTNLEEYREIEIPFNVARVRPPTRPANLQSPATVQLTPEQKALMRQQRAPVSDDAEKDNAQEE